MKAPAVGEQGELPCLCCQRPTRWQVIPAVSRGAVYLACLSCGMVIHTPRKDDDDAK